MGPTTKPRLKPIIVDYPQRSAEWRAARIGNVTGSDGKKAFYDIGIQETNRLFREVFGVGSITKNVRESQDYQDFIARDRYELFVEHGQTPPEPGPRVQYRRLKLAERLTGMSADPDGGFVTHDMKWGQISESLAKSKYSLLTGNPIKEAPFLLHPELRVGASPDGFITDIHTGLMGVAEAKCLRSHNHLYDIMKLKEIPEEFMVQINMEMWISGTDFCDFIGYDSRVPSGLDIFVKRVERDDEYIENVLEPEIKRFLDDLDKDERFFRMLAREERERIEREGLIRLPEGVS